MSALTPFLEPEPDKAGELDTSTRTKPNLKRSRWLGIVVISLVISLLLYVGLVPHATRHQSDDFVDKHTRPGQHRFPTQLGQCPSNAPPRASPPVPINVWASLNSQDTAQIQAWLESGAGNFNLTKSNGAATSDNSIFNIEAYRPHKNTTLAYLNNPQKAEAPPRVARVTIHHGGLENPVVRDYLVGPLPISSRTTVQPLKDIYHLEDIPYNARGLGDLSEAFNFMEGVIKPISGAMKDLFGGIMGNGQNDTFTAGPTGPWSYDGSFRRIWVTWRYNTAGSFIQPINFYNYIDMSGTDPSLWKILRIVYHDQMFPSVESFLEAYQNGTLHRRPRPSIPQDELPWSSRRRVGKPRDLDHLPGPRSVSFAGLRFRVDRQQQYISWMGWGMYLGFDRDMGLSLWDIRFRGERIIYQLAPQEAIAQYAGGDPVQSTTAWLDRFFGMGTLVRNLIPGYDCPQEAVYLPAETYSIYGHILREKGICVFEQDAGKALTRHVGDIPGETGAVKSYILTVRSISTFDYLFYLDGTIQVQISASGYLQGGYWTPEQKNYGHRIRDFSMGSLHDHVINFKVDLDIAGEANSFLKTSMSQEEVDLPWADDDWGSKVIQQRIKREYVDVEDDARLNYANNFQGSIAIVNKEQTNKWGNPRGYALHPGYSPIHNTVVGSKRLEKNANWARNNIAVTKRKENEPSSSSMWNLHLSGAPAVNFDNFFDGDSLDQEDLVMWVNVGTHHLPQAEDSPNTKTNIATTSFLLTPLNYFDSDPSMESMNAITLTEPETPGEAFGFDDNGVKQDFNCIPRDVPPFSYRGEDPLFEQNHLDADNEDAYGKLHTLLHPLRIKTGV
ncbi:amine oxidase catalytic domain-containing protein [Coprinopsis marcescibilis]|uniref:Amine oxidase n=1 Tax=Coprinopsis marcescibilis TaxID=230819 RepID=A0A5C3KDD1_COPMA|nr:amine oxidase catalytic domain-containing protein [Coprinopsis marcescibilis]